MGSLVICLTPYDFSGPLIDYFHRWRKLIQDPRNKGIILLQVLFIQSYISLGNIFVVIEDNG